MVITITPPLFDLTVSIYFKAHKCLSKQKHKLTIYNRLKLKIFMQKGRISSYLSRTNYSN